MIPDRLVAFARRVVAYNRQPRKLALLPLSITAAVLADGVLWFAGYVREGYRTAAPRAK